MMSYITWRSCWYNVIGLNQFSKCHMEIC